MTQSKSNALQRLGNGRTRPRTALTDLRKPPTDRRVVAAAIVALSVAIVALAQLGERDCSDAGPIEATDGDVRRRILALEARGAL